MSRTEENMSRIDEIAARHAAATPAVLSMHREMLDICNGDFSDRDAAWFYTWIAEWFNTIKQHWPFEDIAYLTAELVALTARAEKAEHERDRAIEDLSTTRDCGFCAYIQDQKYCYEYCQRHVDVDNFRTYPCWQWRGLPRKGE